jgi:hypothetical protein
MSMFLPDGAQGTVPPSGVTDFSPATDEVTSSDIAIMQRVLSAAAQNPSMIPESFMAYVLDWLQINNLQIPIKQVFGYQDSVGSIVSEALAGQFVASSATGAGSSSGSPVTGAVGPAVSGLVSGGKYVVWYGYNLHTNDNATMHMSGGLPAATDGNGSGPVALAGVIPSLSGTTITSTYDWATGGGGFINSLYIIALRVS